MELPKWVERVSRAAVIAAALSGGKIEQARAANPNTPPKNTLEQIYDNSGIDLLDLELPPSLDEVVDRSKLSNPAEFRIEQFSRSQREVIAKAMLSDERFGDAKNAEAFEKIPEKRRQDVILQISAWYERIALAVRNRIADRPDLNRAQVSDLKTYKSWFEKDGIDVDNYEEVKAELEKMSDEELYKLYLHLMRRMYDLPQEVKKDEVGDKPKDKMAQDTETKGDQVIEVAFVDSSATKQRDKDAGVIEQLEDEGNDVKDLGVEADPDHGEDIADAEDRPPEEEERKYKYYDDSGHPFDWNRKILYYEKGEKAEHTDLEKVETHKPGVYVELRKDAAIAWSRLKARAATEGVILNLTEGNRTEKAQAAMKKKRGVWAHDPEYSEHRLGTAGDLRGGNTTVVYNWMFNTHKTLSDPDFIPPAVAEGWIPTVRKEPWHIRYVGVDQAKAYWKKYGQKIVNEHARRMRE